MKKSKAHLGGRYAMFKIGYSAEEMAEDLRSALDGDAPFESEDDVRDYCYEFIDSKLIYSDDIWDTFERYVQDSQLFEKFSDEFAEFESDVFDNLPELSGYVWRSPSAWRKHFLVFDDEEWDCRDDGWWSYEGDDFDVDIYPYSGGYRVDLFYSQYGDPYEYESVCSGTAGDIACAFDLAEELAEDLYGKGLIKGSCRRFASVEIDDTVYDAIQSITTGDPWVEDMDKDITLREFLDGMNAGEDVYDLLGVFAPTLREWAFCALEAATGIDYDVFYDAWRNPGVNQIPLIAMRGVAQKKISADDKAAQVEWSDGWVVDGVPEMEDLVYVLENIGRLEYEVRHCRKGYTSNANTYEALGEYARILGQELIDAGEEVRELVEEDGGLLAKRAKAKKGAAMERKAWSESFPASPYDIIYTDHRTWADEDEYEVGWSSIGTVSVDDAIEFANAILDVCSAPAKYAKKNKTALVDDGGVAANPGDVVWVSAPNGESIPTIYVGEIGDDFFCVDVNGGGDVCSYPKDGDASSLRGGGDETYDYDIEKENGVYDGFVSQDEIDRIRLEYGLN